MPDEQYVRNVVDILFRTRTSPHGPRPPGPRRQRRRSASRIKIWRAPWRADPFGGGLVGTPPLHPTCTLLGKRFPSRPGFSPRNNPQKIL